jgi:hypothetical protein
MLTFDVSLHAGSSLDYSILGVAGLCFLQMALAGHVRISLLMVITALLTMSIERCSGPGF